MQEWIRPFLSFWIAWTPGPRAAMFANCFWTADSSEAVSLACCAIVDIGNRIRHAKVTGNSMLSCRYSFMLMG